MSTREAGNIDHVFCGVEPDRGILTCNIGINFKGSHQAFGGLAFGKKEDGYADSFVKDLCKVFGVRKLEELKGMKCFALRCFDSYNTTIEGLEAPNGKCFTLTDWRRKHFKDVKNPLEEKRHNLLSEAEHLVHKIKKNAEALAALDRNYIDWASKTRSKKIK